MTQTRLPTLFVPHGAGPCFFMDWEPAGTWDVMATWLKGLQAQIGSHRPEALLVISAHWETPVPTVNAASQPGLLYDYYGFPESTYQIAWPAKGHPALAQQIVELLTDAGFAPATDVDRGLDHGVFIPLKLAFPDADIPVVQLSLQQGLDPATHMAMGRALAPLREQGVLIIGSGMSYHNMQRFRRRGGPADPDSERFDDWLGASVGLTGTARSEQLAGWRNAPGGRIAHPREEHLLPLYVVAGAAQDESGVRVLQDQVMGSVQSAFRFGDAA